MSETSNYYADKYGTPEAPIDLASAPAETFAPVVTEESDRFVKAPTDNYYADKYGIPEVTLAESKPESFEDPTWGDYGRIALAGGVQLGGGVGWLAEKIGIDAGATLQKAASEKANSIMEGLTDSAKDALAVEFTSRDDGELWTDRKWRKAKLIAAQSLIGTAAGMGIGSLLTKGLAIAGMSKAVTTAAGATIQAPTRAAGAIGLGLGESIVAAPSSAASAEAQVMAMSTEQLQEDSIEFRAILANMDTPDPERARKLLARAIGGEVFASDLITTFLLSAPLGYLVGGFAGKLPLATTRTRSIAVGAGGEAGQEFVQSGAEQIGSNVGLQRADPSIPTFQGALEQSTGGFLAGGITGAGPGAIAPLQAPSVTPDPEADALDTQINADLTTEELAQAGDSLSAQLAGAQNIQKEIDALLQSDLTARRETELAGTELEIADRQERIADEQRSAAFLKGEQSRDARLEAQRREAEFQQELQKGEEAEQLAKYEAPVSDDVELAAKSPLKTSLAPAMQEAFEKSQAKTKEQLETVGEEVEAEALVAPEKPKTPKTTKAPNPERDSLLTLAAKSPVNRRLSQRAFAEEGLDIEALREPVYGGKPAFSKHKDAMTPDDVAEFLNEQGYPTKDGKLWDANSALEAVTNEVEGREKIFTSQGMETAETERSYQEALDTFDQATERRATVGAPKVHNITVDGVEARVSEEPEGDIEVAIGDSTTNTSRKKGETNADLVRAVIAAQPKTETETEAETEAREEREVIQAADQPVEEETEADIPGFEETTKAFTMDDFDNDKEVVHKDPDSSTGYINQLGDEVSAPDLETKVNEAATSPTNDLSQPTEGQKSAGNYQKGHIQVAGLDISIENPKGSTRRGFKQKDHYGYIKRTEGADGDQVDVFVNPKVPEDFEGTVYVIDQTQEDGETFDEHKVMLGYKNKLDAIRGYKRNYFKGWHVGPVTEMTVEEFKTWLKGDTTTPVTESNKTSRQERKFVRDKKGHLRYSLPRAKKALLEDTQDAVPGADMAFVEQVVGAPTEGSDPAVQRIVDQITRLEQARTDESETGAERIARMDAVLEAEIDRINKVFPGANIQYVEKAKVEGIVDEKIQAGTNAVYDTESETIYIFKNHLLPINTLRKLALHEMFHKGLHKTMGKRMDALLDDFVKNMPEKYRDLYKQKLIDYELEENLGSDRREAAEEVLAEIAETEPDATILNRLIALVRKFLRDIGVLNSDTEWTKSEITSLIAEAHNALARQAKPISEVTLTEAVQVEETGEIFDVKTNAEIVLRQHDKRVGVIEKLKACL